MITTIILAACVITLLCHLDTVLKLIAFAFCACLAVLALGFCGGMFTAAAVMLLRVLS